MIFMFPFSRIIITKYYIIFFLLIFSSTSTANKSNHEEKLKLKNIQIRMNDVSTKIKEAKNKVNTLQIELHKNELMTFEISSQLENIKNDISKKNSTLKKLKIEKGNHQKILSTEKKILISQIKTIYKIGQYDYIKLLLNQQNISQVGRVIAYYDYDNHARSKRIKKLKDTLKNINKIQSIIFEQTSKLELQKNNYKSKLNNFNDYRENRLNFIYDIKKHIEKQGVELLLLKENERELAKLLNELKVRQSKKINTVDKKFTFDSKKGKLIWPIKGKLLKKFGEPKKTTKLKWQGVLIGAKAGSDVNAVSEGKIVFADWFRNFGLLVIIEHENGYLSLYGHNQKLFKSTGNFVKTGEKIAAVGDSGGQNNAALYFEIRKGKKTLNPSHWCKK
jgi:septal ring factor EnvC (AmiA/AmiB activator)